VSASYAISGYRVISKKNTNKYNLYVSLTAYTAANDVAKISWVSDAKLFTNNKLFDKKTFEKKGKYYIDSKDTYLGEVNFELPVFGKVVLEIFTSYTAHTTDGIGAINGDKETIPLN
jgi:hypothetical protein